MCFVDNEGNILVPKAVRPLMEYKPTMLGEKKGSIKQYRHGKLHIREYDDCYSVHYDKIDPHKDPFGHILVDASKYVPSMVMISVLSDYILNSKK